MRTRRERQQRRAPTHASAHRHIFSSISCVMPARPASLILPAAVDVALPPRATHTQTASSLPAAADCALHRTLCDLTRPGRASARRRHNRRKTIGPARFGLAPAHAHCARCAPVQSRNRWDRARRVGARRAGRRHARPPSGRTPRSASSRCCTPSTVRASIARSPMRSSAERFRALQPVDRPDACASAAVARAQPTGSGRASDAARTGTAAAAARPRPQHIANEAEPVAHTDRSPQHIPPSMPAAQPLTARP